MFSYLDAKEDFHLLQFFNIKPDDIPKIIIYDFSKGMYFIDKYSYLDDPNALVMLDDLVKRIGSGQIKWTTGYLIEDLLSMCGISVSRTTLTIIFLGIFTLFVIILIFIFCACLEKYEKIETKTKIN